ncbi:hypothetical protein [Sphingobacterium sp.]|uniref:hypothetical protein n=1 Tax=Sphingobacterium sp. TaxID=341027 RepID=UPI0025870B53|nr:hypothetical protein [Sphingobacterium sp.]WET67550.1 MAG: hypothetical protein P0Y57_17070 [Sphingobacterium sp.]
MDKILSTSFPLFMDSAKAGIPSSAGYKKIQETTIFKFFMCMVQFEVTVPAINDVHLSKGASMQQSAHMYFAIFL